MKKHSLLFTLVAVLMIIGCFTTGCQPIATTNIAPSPTEYVIEDTPTPAPTSTKKLSHIEPIEHINKVISTKTENISIKFDANVKVPESTTFPIVELVPKRITQEQVDNFLDTFFKDRTNELPVEYDRPLTKSDIKKEIRLREKWIEIANKSIPKDSKRKSTYIPKWENQIEQYKEYLKDAPETVTDDITKFAPFPKSIRIYDDDEPEYTKQFTYYSEIQSIKEKMYNFKKLNYAFRHNNKEYLVYAHQSDFPQNNVFHLNCLEGTYISPLGKDSIEENYENIPLLKTTYSEAKKIADEAKEVLGLNGMDLYKSSIYNSRFYYFIYTWDVEGTNVTYTGDYYSSYFYILIDDSGIVEARYSEPTEYKSTLPKKVEFLPFDKIIDIACEKMDSEEYIYNRFEKRRYTNDIKINNYDIVIEKVELGYMMIKGYGEKDKSYTLIPVWDIFGHENCSLSISCYDENDTYEFNNSNEYCTHRSLLTINAINGQVIDRRDNYWRD